MKVGHQAMTWSGWWKKNDIPFDVETLLREVKEAGYDGVELGGTAERLGPADRLKERLAAHGLEVPAWAVSVTANPWPPNTEQYRRSMDYAAEMDRKILMCCGGFLGEGGRRNTFDDDYKLFAENLRAAQEYASQYGQTIAYHPHRGCIVETVEEVDRLFRFEPNVMLCPDTGHLVSVRADPVELIRKYADKILHTHVKDFDVETHEFAELGRGNAGQDFAGIFAALKDIGYDTWLVVERDNPPMPGIESAKISREFLRSMGY